jgi:hypothetical protein
MNKWLYVFIIFMLAIWFMLSYGAYVSWLVTGQLVEWQLALVLLVFWLFFAGIVYVVTKKREWA